jgi:hypothetical protein
LRVFHNDKIAQRLNYKVIVEIAKGIFFRTAWEPFGSIVSAQKLYYAIPFLSCNDRRAYGLSFGTIWVAILQVFYNEIITQTLKKCDYFGDYKGTTADNAQG